MKKTRETIDRDQVMANTKPDKDITESDEERLQAVTLQAMIYRMIQGQKECSDPSERDRALFESLLVTQFGDPKQCRFVPDKDMRYLCSTCGFPKDKH